MRRRIGSRCWSWHWQRSRLPLRAGHRAPKSAAGKDRSRTPASRRSADGPTSPSAPRRSLATLVSPSSPTSMRRRCDRARSDCRGAQRLLRQPPSTVTTLSGSVTALGGSGPTFKPTAALATSIQNATQSVRAVEYGRFSCFLGKKGGKPAGGGQSPGQRRPPKINGITASGIPTSWRRQRLHGRRLRAARARRDPLRGVRWGRHTGRRAVRDHHRDPDRWRSGARGGCPGKPGFTDDPVRPGDPHPNASDPSVTTHPGRDAGREHELLGRVTVLVRDQATEGTTG